MNEQTAVLEPVEPVRGRETNGIGPIRVATIRRLKQVEIGVKEDIVAGSVLVNSTVALPESMRFASKQYGSWKILAGFNGATAGRKLSEAGWHFFFVVPEIKRSVLSSNRSKALRTSFKKIISATEAQNLNALEIVRVTTRSFLGIHYVKVVAHSRHIKSSPYLRDLNPHHVSRNVWDFKQILRRRAQIGRSTKGI